MRDSGKLVDIWIRVSTEDRARGENLEYHEKKALFYDGPRDGRPEN